MSKAEELIRLYALRKVGEVSESDVVIWGEKAVVADDRVLPIALLKRSALRHDVDLAIQSVAVAMLVTLPDDSEVAEVALIEICKEIVSGVIRPIDGARSLDAIGRQSPALLRKVAVFVGILDEFDDGLRSKDEAGASIMTWAGRLVAQAKEHGLSGPLPWECDK